MISESWIDFEDSGVDEGTVKELKKVWQERLSSLNVATMPWDPEANSTTSTTDNNPESANKNNNDGETANNNSNGQIKQEETAIKKEPINEDDGLQTSTLTNNDNNSNGTSNNDKNNNSGGLVLPGGGQMSQADGASDLPLTTEQIDKIVAYKLKRTKKDALEQENPKLEINLTTDKLNKIIQSDGADDQSDDINSDLDDPDDDPNSGDEEEDDDGGMIMLCLYDRVQRVKNKWKYILKDGIANINGKDYIFSRGSGESEW